MLEFCEDLNVVDGEELILVVIPVEFIYPSTSSPFSVAQGLID